MKYQIWRMYRGPMGGADCSIGEESTWKRTRITVLARTEKEALSKAKRFMKAAEYGMIDIKVVKELGRTLTCITESGMR